MISPTISWKKLILCVIIIAKLDGSSAGGPAPVRRPNSCGPSLRRIEFGKKYVLRSPSRQRTCQWKLQTDRGLYIKLTFVEARMNLFQTNIRLVDIPRKGSFRWDRRPYLFHGRDIVLGRLLTFNQDVIGVVYEPAEGSLLTVNYEAVLREGKCGFNDFANKRVKRIKSPGYPTASYDGEMDCTWKLRARGEKRRVHFQIKNIRLNAGEDLKIYDEEKLIYSYQTSTPRTSFISSTVRGLVVRFTATSIESGRGFSATFRLATEDEIKASSVVSPSTASVTTTVPGSEGELTTIPSTPHRTTAISATSAPVSGAAIRTTPVSPSTTSEALFTTPAAPSTMPAAPSATSAASSATPAASLATPAALPTTPAASPTTSATITTSESSDALKCYLLNKVTALSSGMVLADTKDVTSCPSGSKCFLSTSRASVEVFGVVTQVSVIYGSCTSSQYCGTTVCDESKSERLGENLSEGLNFTFVSCESSYCCDDDLCNVPITHETTTPQISPTPNPRNTAECYNESDSGVSYRGNANKTITGLECQSWSSQTPHSHTRTAEIYPTAGLEGNLCRNPDGEERPWCYTTSPSTRWQFCDIQACPESSDALECYVLNKVTALSSGMVLADTKYVTSCPSGSICFLSTSRASVVVFGVVTQVSVIYGSCTSSQYCGSTVCDQLKSERLGDNLSQGLNFTFASCESSCCDDDLCNVPITHESTTAQISPTPNPSNTAECYNQSDSGASYRGNANKTITGLDCQSWSSQTPHSHTRTAENYPTAGLEGNLCRNPDGEERPWCYTTSPSKRWQFCAIQACPDVANEIKTTPVAPSTTPAEPSTSPVASVTTTESESSDDLKCYLLNKVTALSSGMVLADTKDVISCPSVSKCFLSTSRVFIEVFGVATEVSVIFGSCTPSVYCGTTLCDQLQSERLGQNLGQELNMTFVTCESSCCDANLCNLPILEQTTAQISSTPNPDSAESIKTTPASASSTSPVTPRIATESSATISQQTQPEVTEPSGTLKCYLLNKVTALNNGKLLADTKSMTSCPSGSKCFLSTSKASVEVLGVAMEVSVIYGSCTPSRYCGAADVCEQLKSERLGQNLSQGLNFTFVSCESSCCDMNLCNDPIAQQTTTAEIFSTTFSAATEQSKTAPGTSSTATTSIAAQSSDTLKCYSRNKVTAISSGKVLADTKDVMSCQSGSKCFLSTSKASVEVFGVVTEVSVVYGSCTPSQYCGTTVCDQLQSERLGESLGHGLNFTFVTCGSSCCDENLCNIDITPQTTTSQISPTTVSDALDKIESTPAPPSPSTTTGKATEPTATMPSIPSQGPSEECYMGMKSRSIPDSSITASTFWGAKHEPYQARMDNVVTGQSTGSWSAKTNAIGQWLQIELESAQPVSGIITQGRPNLDQWVQSYKVACGWNQDHLAILRENGQEKVFTGNNDMNSKVYNQFSQVFSCRVIRIYPQSWHKHISMRVELVHGSCFDNENPPVTRKPMRTSPSTELSTSYATTEPVSDDPMTTATPAEPSTSSATSTEPGALDKIESTPAPQSSSTTTGKATEPTATMPPIPSQGPSEECYMGMKSRSIPDSSISASTFWGANHEPYQARLDNVVTGQSTGSWSTKTNAIGQWLQIELGSAQPVSGIITQGRPTLDQWVQSYKVACGWNQNHLAVLRENGQEKVFSGNNDMNTKVYNEFSQVFSCRVMRIYPQSWHKHISMRVELVHGSCFDNENPPVTRESMRTSPSTKLSTSPATTTEPDDPITTTPLTELSTSSATSTEPALERITTAATTTPSTTSTTTRAAGCYMGMKSRVIPDSAITASSFWSARHAPFQGRMDNRAVSGKNAGSWTSRKNTRGQWLQVDLGSVQSIAGIITQGRPTYSMWVQSYKVSCGLDEDNLTVVKENEREKVFAGNRNRRAKVYSQFPQVLQCRYIRIYPQTWRRHISMRVEIVHGSCFNSENLP